MKALLAGLLVAMVASSAHADAPADLRTGTFKGVWCGYAASLEIADKDRAKWVFHGTIYFPGFDLRDKLWVEQYSDDSLRMIRYLSGANTGLTQTVQTYPPTIRGGGYAEFDVSQANGPDCEGKPTHFTNR